MANTYTQCYFHLVFAVKHRESLIKKSWKNELEMYITGIVQNHKHKLLAIGSIKKSFPGRIHRKCLLKMKLTIKRNICLIFLKIHANGLVSRCAAPELKSYTDFLQIVWC